MAKGVVNDDDLKSLYREESKRQSGRVEAGGIAESSRSRTTSNEGSGDDRIRDRRSDFLLSDLCGDGLFADVLFADDAAGRSAGGGPLRLDVESSAGSQ